MLFLGFCLFNSRVKMRLEKKPSMTAWLRDHCSSCTEMVRLVGVARVYCGPVPLLLKLESARLNLFAVCWLWEILRWADLREVFDLRRLTSSLTAWLLFFRSPMAVSREEGDLSLETYVTIGVYSD